MKSTVHPFSMGFARTYLVDLGGGFVLVDSGFAGRTGSLWKQLRRLGARARDLRLVVVTHAHFDHAGGLAEIKRRTGAPVAVHGLEAANLKLGSSPVPRPVSMLGRLGVAATRLLPGLFEFEPVEPDIKFELEGNADLSAFGLFKREGARIVHTPGHTPGSVSLLLAGGEAIVGDLVIGRVGRFLPAHVSAYTEDPGEAKRSLGKLVALGARLFYPGHGRRVRLREVERIIGG